MILVQDEAAMILRCKVAQRMGVLACSHCRLPDLHAALRSSLESLVKVQVRFCQWKPLAVQICPVGMIVPWCKLGCITVKADELMCPRDLGKNESASLLHSDTTVSSVTVSLQ